MEERRSLIIEDQNGDVSKVHDLRMYNEKLYFIKDHGFKFTLERNLYQFDENDSIDINEDVIWESNLVGTYENDKKYY